MSAKIVLSIVFIFVLLLITTGVVYSMMTKTPEGIIGSFFLGVLGLPLIVASLMDEDDK